MTALDRAIGDFQQRNPGWSRGGSLKTLNLLRAALAEVIPDSNIGAVTIVNSAARAGMLISGADFVACGFIKGVFKERVTDISVLPRSEIVRFDAVPNSIDGFNLEIMTRLGAIQMMITRHLANPALEAALVTEIPSGGSQSMGGGVASVCPGSERLSQNQDTGNQQLPWDIIAMMERFGRHEFDPTSVEARADTTVWEDTQAPLVEYAMSDPDGFTQTLVSAVLPVGGWAAYGAVHTIYDLALDELKDSKAAYTVLLDLSLDFLRESGVPPNRVKGFEARRWVERGESMESW